MNAKVTRMMFWMGLLVLLLGENGAVPTGGRMPSLPGKMADSPNRMVAQGGTMPLPPPPLVSRDTMSNVS
jgi:hypothetical protein